MYAAFNEFLTMVPYSFLIVQNNGFMKLIESLPQTRISNPYILAT